jgi:hypothetical protein
LPLSWFYRHPANPPFDRGLRFAHDRNQFIVNDFNQGLAGREATDDFLAKRFFPHIVDEILDYRQGDIGLEQRHPHFTQTVANIVFAEPTLTAQVFQRFG